MGENNTIAYCGIDVVVSDRKRGLDLIRKTLRRLGAPRGTLIEAYLPSYREHPVHA